MNFSTGEPAAIPRRLYSVSGRGGVVSPIGGLLLQPFSELAVDGGVELLGGKALLGGALREPAKPRVGQRGLDDRPHASPAVLRVHFFEIGVGRPLVALGPLLLARDQLRMPVLPSAHADSIAQSPNGRPV